ncbi:MAG: hypothetical protein IIT86_11645 [Oscillospiraceae bacterium]|nr:hypothetical protein [Oscillospiraceae bacterium]
MSARQRSLDFVKSRFIAYELYASYKATILEVAEMLDSTVSGEKWFEMEIIHKAAQRQLVFRTGAVLPYSSVMISMGIALSYAKMLKRTLI